MLEWTLVFVFMMSATAADVQVVEGFDSQQNCVEFFQTIQPELPPVLSAQCLPKNKLSTEM